MQHTRVRYVKHELDPVNMLRSSKAFKTAEGFYVYVNLHKVSMQYNLSNATTREIVASGGRTKNLTVLKIQAKQALIHLGVEFAEDVRTFEEPETNETETV